MSQDVKIRKTGEKLPQFRSIALIAVGGNSPSVVGDAAETIQKAVSDIQKDIGVIRAISAFYRTPAFPAGSGPEFVNAAFVIETALQPAELLRALHEIEARYGRDRSKRWGPRTLDLDIVGYGDVVLPDVETHAKWVDLTLEEQMSTVPDSLILPHPRLAERAFVLVPLNDVAPDWQHPITGKSVQQMLQALSTELVSEVIRL